MALNGLSIDLPFTGDPDPTLPYAGDYDALETFGSLALYEAAHSAKPVVGVPSLGSGIPNILWRQLSDARVAAGLAVGTVTGSDAIRVGSADVANVLLTERTAKGGLHGIISQTNMANNNQSLLFQSGADLTTYLNLLYAHKFYISIWDRVTRVAVNSTPSESHIIKGATFTNRIYFTTNGGIEGNSLTTLDSFRNDPSTLGAVTGNQFRSALTKGAIGTSDNNTALPIIVGCAGPYASATLTAVGNKSASRVNYRYYLEDVTVSAAAQGITTAQRYADLNAADYAAWLQAFSVNGRYYNDTFTAPAI